MKRILVVDDDPPSLRLMEQLLSRQGYAVLTAACQDGALRVFQQWGGSVDLLITDVVLPGTQRGHELAWHLTEQNPELRVLLVSAHASGHNELTESIRASRTGFLEKPFDPDELLQTVQALLS